MHRYIHITVLVFVTSAGTPVLARRESCLEELANELYFLQFEKPPTVLRKGVCSLGGHSSLGQNH